MVRLAEDRTWALITGKSLLARIARVYTLMPIPTFKQGLTFTIAD